jgi:hypothetical protein
VGVSVRRMREVGGQGRPSSPQKLVTLDWWRRSWVFQAEGPTKQRQGVLVEMGRGFSRLLASRAPHCPSLRNSVSGPPEVPFPLYLF